MEPFSFKLTINIIYILFLLQNKSQYTEIWYDDMEQNNGWHEWTGPDDFGPLVVFSYASVDSCFTNLCTLTDAEMSTNAYILRSTDISAYSSLKLQFDVTASDLENKDTCKVYYAYDSTASKTSIATFEAPTGDRYKYPNQTAILPSSVSEGTVHIWLEADTADPTGSDRCYWDNVYLMGILETAATPDPTKQPTSNPLQNPTENPTLQPTDISTTTSSTSTSDTATTTATTNAISESTTVEGHETETIDTSVTETYTLRTTKYKSTISNPTEIEQHTTMFTVVKVSNMMSTSQSTINSTNMKSTLNIYIVVLTLFASVIAVIIMVFVTFKCYQRYKKEQTQDVHKIGDIIRRDVNERDKPNISIQPSVEIQTVNNANKNRKHRKRDSDSERLYDVHVVSNHTKRKISDSEQLYTKRPISTDTMDTITTAGTANASDTNTKIGEAHRGEENRVEDNDAIGYGEKYAQNINKNTCTNDIDSDEGYIVDCSHWKAKQIVYWIINLDCGIFSEYEYVLTTRLKNEQINGTSLRNIDVPDLKRWGITNVDHMERLLKHIRALVQHKKRVIMMV